MHPGQVLWTAVKPHSTVPDHCPPHTGPYVCYTQTSPRKGLWFSFTRRSWLQSLHFVLHFLMHVFTETRRPGESPSSCPASAWPGNPTDHTGFPRGYRRSSKSQPVNSKVGEPSPTYQKGLLAPFPLEEANAPSAPQFITKAWTQAVCRTDARAPAGLAHSLLRGPLLLPHLLRLLKQNLILPAS